MDVILKYFPNLTERQRGQFAALLSLYADWNAKINVISRKDMDAFYEHHVLHSLAVAKVVSFRPLAQVLDVGTGGGFPGIPLAILFPETHFTLVDSIGKKIHVVNEVAQALRLDNVKALQCRAEQLGTVHDRSGVNCPQNVHDRSGVNCPQNVHDHSGVKSPQKFDFIVSRAVTALPELVGWVRGLVSPANYHNLHNGLLCLKGGDLGEELKPFGKKATVYNIADFFEESFFETKKVVYLPL